MTYETTTTKAMTDRELAEAIVDDRISRGQFGEDDRDWLVEREMRETRESLVNGFNAIEHWDGTDMMTEEPEEPRRLFDGDLGGLLGDFEWQYDLEAVYDAISEFDYATCQRFYKADDDMPDWDDVDAACMWSPIVDNIDNILDWYNQHADTEILDVDPEMVLEALTIDVDGEREWLPLSCRQVDDIIYDFALVTSDNMGTRLASDIDEDHIDEMWEVLEWADVTPLWIDSDREEHVLGEIWWAMTTGHGAYVTWKHMTRAQVAEVVDEVLA